MIFTWSKYEEGRYVRSPHYVLETKNGEHDNFCVYPDHATEGWWTAHGGYGNEKESFPTEAEAKAQVIAWYIAAHMEGTAE